MKEKELIKYFDILLSKINDIGNFNVSKCLPEANIWGTNNLEKDKRRERAQLNESLKNFGIAHKYFENITEFTFRLTLKGIKAKKLGGHLKYEMSIEKINSKNWYNEPWVGYIIAFITLLFAFYQGFQNHSLEKDISSSKLSIDSLRNEDFSHKKKLDSLNARYVLFESKLSDLKNNTDKKK